MRSGTLSLAFAAALTGSCSSQVTTAMPDAPPDMPSTNAPPPPGPDAPPGDAGMVRGADAPPVDAGLPFGGYNPTAVGDSWTYRISFTGQTPSNQTVTVSKNAGSTYELVTTVDDGSSTFVDTYQVTSAGASLSSETDTFNGSMSVSTLTYQPPYLLIPADLSSGKVVTSTTLLTMTSGTSTTQVSYMATITVNGAESVQVPAGTFTALKLTTVVVVQTIPSGETGTVTGRHWLAKDVGYVKADSSDGTWTMELVSSNLH